MLLGYNRLVQLIVKYGDKAETAIIYNNMTGTALAKYKAGFKVT